MKSSNIFLCLALLSAHGTATAQMPDSIRLHIDSCLAVLKQHSLYAAGVHWKKTTKQVYARAKNARTKADTFEALKIAFEALGDKHAAYYQYNDEYRLKNKALTGRYSDSIRKAWARGPRINAIMLDSIAYLSVPYMGAFTQQQIEWYANWLGDSLASLQRRQPTGWIIDLRLNGGGNIRPMLAGLAVFFPDGILSCFVDRNGHITDEATVYDGALFIDGVKQVGTRSRLTPAANAKVAVLTGPGTASSGRYWRLFSGSGPIPVCWATARRDWPMLPAASY